MTRFFLAACLLTALGLGAFEVRPFAEAVPADRLIIRMSFSTEQADWTDIPAALTVHVQDGGFAHRGNLLPLNPIPGFPEADYEFLLGETVTLSAQCTIRLENMPAWATVREILPWLPQKDDLAAGLDCETPQRSGFWLGNLGGIILHDDQNVFRSRGAMAATWQEHQMVTLLPGVRDWTPYAELRFIVSNPLPPPDGTRDRNLFLFDGRKVHRPTPKDSIPQGNILVAYESSKEFRLDLKLLKQNNPLIALNDMRAIQFFWSSTPSTGSTTFYFDDICLLTEKQIRQELDAIYEQQFRQIQAEYDKLLNGQSPWQQRFAMLQQRFSQGERKSLDDDIRILKEELLNAQLLVGFPQDQPCRIVPTGPMEKIFRDRAFAFQEAPWRLSAAGNERESFQLVLAPRHPLQQVQLFAADLRTADGAILPEDCVKIHPVGYVEISESFFYSSSRTGFWPDILHENRPFDLPCRVQPFMVTVAVPENQQPGLYRGSIEVTAQNMAAQQIPFELQVYRFSLPLRGQCKVLFTANYVPENPQLRRKVYDLLFDYRLSPTSMYTRINKNAPTRTVPDFEDLAYCMKKGMNMLLFGEILDRPAADPHSFSEEYIQAVLDWIGYCRPILQEHGAWEISYLCGFDEIMHRPEPQRTQRLQQASKILSRIKQAYPDCKIANVGRLMELSPDLMDQWFCSPIPEKDFSPILQSGGQVGFYWVYQDPSFMLDLPGTAPRICSWMAFREKANGIAYYSTFRPHDTCPEELRIPPSKTHKQGSSICHEACCPEPPLTLDWQQAQFEVRGTRKFARNGDGFLFYPAPDRSLLASMRLVALRDGIEDFEYLKILSDLSDGKHPLLDIPENIVTLKDYTTDPRTLQNYRQQIADAIERLLQEKTRSKN
ncbi:MAG: DUF6067 family protein [Lentisphaeria bacterium]|nr:DUF6067 family protein [Lentisphaeria bacterium]